MSAVPAILALFDIGATEFLVLMAAAVMLFGGDLPDVARKAGRAVRKLRNLASEAAKNLDVPRDLSRLPGAAEFKAGYDEDERDHPMNLDLGDLAKEIDIDWRDVARLPDMNAPAKPAAAATAASPTATPTTAAAPPAAPAAAEAPSPATPAESTTSSAPSSGDASASRG